MKDKFKIFTKFILYGIGWPLAVLTNFTTMILGLIDPRQFLEYTFGYNARKKCWFNSTNFGWYWKCTRLSNDYNIKNNWFLRNLLRVRMVLALPISFLSCCFHYWCNGILKNEPPTISVYTKRYLKVIKDGYYNLKEKEYYYEEGGIRGSVR